MPKQVPAFYQPFSQPLTGELDPSGHRQKRCGDARRFCPTPRPRRRLPRRRPLACVPMTPCFLQTNPWGPARCGCHDAALADPAAPTVRGHPRAIARAMAPGATAAPWGAHLFFKQRRTRWPLSPPIPHTSAFPRTAQHAGRTAPAPLHGPSSPSTTSMVAQRALPGVRLLHPAPAPRLRVSRHRVISARTRHGTATAGTRPRPYNGTAPASHDTARHCAVAHGTARILLARHPCQSCWRCVTPTAEHQRRNSRAPAHATA